MPRDPRPNIIFIVADDLGFADLGCYGGRDAEFGKVSPVIDGLAERGLKFTQGYSNSPVCSPTRFALMTARYQYRLRGAAEEPINSKSRGSTTLGLPPEHPTLPSLLRASGYRTALIGKWHLGYPPAFGPLAGTAPAGGCSVALSLPASSGCSVDCHTATGTAGSMLGSSWAKLATGSAGCGVSISGVSISTASPCSAGLAGSDSRCIASRKPRALRGRGRRTPSRK